MGDMGGTWRFRVAKIVPLQYQIIEDREKVPLTVSVH